MEKNISQEKRIEELEARLKEQEKLGSLGLLSAGIAHEIQNPLNFVINFSKLSGQLLADLADRLDEAKARIPEAELEDIKDILSGLRENVDKIKEHGDRAISIIRGILLYSRGKEDEFMPTQIQKLTKEYVWLAYHAMRANYKNFNIAIREDYAKDIPSIRLIPQDFSRAVLNVMNNACYAVWKKWQNAPEGYSPEIMVTLEKLDKRIVLSIRDNGEGMGPEVKRKLFDSFFTTKPVGQGTGLAAYDSGIQLSTSSRCSSRHFRTRSSSSMRASLSAFINELISSVVNLILLKNFAAKGSFSVNPFHPTT